MRPEAYYFQEEDCLSFKLPFILFFFFGYGVLNHVLKNPIPWFIYNSNTYTSEEHLCLGE